MAHLFIRVELRGDPSGSDYDNLHSYMAGLNWHRKINGTAGESDLPHAMYNGYSDKDIATIPGALRSGIEAKVWPRTVVLVISSDNWSMAPS